MRVPLWSSLIVLAVIAIACANPGTRTGSAPAASSPSQLAASAPSSSGESAMTVGFARPLDVAPLPPEGKFEVISESAWPGEKVRVFFFGVQS